jgi:hypothetical protein
MQALVKTREDPSLFDHFQKGEQEFLWDEFAGQVHGCLGFRPLFQTR